MSGTQPVNVLIVDDSAVVRQVLTSVLDSDPGIRVAGVASDPIFAMQRMNREWPDVIVLDIEMPRMDGITFLRKLMGVRPTPVVICSTLTARAAETTMQAMSAGAVSIVTKPTSGLREFLETEGPELIATVKSAAAGNMRHAKAAALALGRLEPASRMGAGGAPCRSGPLPATTERLVAVGTSTGGTQAIEVVLTALPRVSPGIVIVQHMPEKFTAAFASRMNGICPSEVLEASDGDRVLPGRVLIAPGGRHLTVERDGANYRARVSDGAPVNRHRPSVDVLFDSVAEQAGSNALGLIMTGMGDDGARGLLRMRRAGSQTLGQDEATCVVYGMPKAAMEMGAVSREIALQDIAASIVRFAEQS